MLLSNFTLLDMTPFGRQEEWEVSPAGWPQTRPTSGGAAMTVLSLKIDIEGLKRAYEQR